MNGASASDDSYSKSKQLSTLSKTTKEPRIIDLSQDIPQDKAAMASSPGAAAIEKAAKQDPNIRSVIVLEHGDVVSSYYRDDIDPNDKVLVWSVTKSWTSLLLGIMVDEGLLSVDETLVDIFPDESSWTDVTDGSVDFRKSVTVEEILSMSSGLVNNAEDPTGDDSCGGGCFLEDSLS